jgi:hypothetical protein
MDQGERSALLIFLVIAGSYLLVTSLWNAFVTLPREAKIAIAVQQTKKAELELQRERLRRRRRKPKLEVVDGIEVEEEPRRRKPDE